MSEKQLPGNSNSQLQIINEDAMAGLGAQLAALVPAGTIIYLDGDLGAGKTTLVRGFLRAFGHQGAVKSPTFTIVEPYSLDYNKLYNYNELEEELKLDANIVADLDTKKELKKSGLKIYHFDLYRLEDPEELEYLGIRDYLDGQAIALIEWPDKGVGVLPRADLIIKITHQNQGRGIELVSQSIIGAAIVSKLVTNSVYKA